MHKKYKESVNKLKKANKKLQKQKYRLKNKINNMNELTRKLKKQAELSEEAITSIKSCFGETGLNIF